MKTTEAWVIGNGLAGAFVSAELCNAGFRVVQWDDGAPSASSVAAGIFNPVTGKYKNFSWEASTMLEALNDFFETPEFSSLRPFLHKMPVWFPFNSVQEFNDWTHKEIPLEFKKLVYVNTVPKDNERLNNPFGGIEIQGCGWLNVNGFISALRELLLQKFDFKIKNESFELKNYFKLDDVGLPVSSESPADIIVFCEGMQTLKNPLWAKLPLFELKGEILEITIPGYDPDYISVGGVFILPLGNQKFLSGSTYLREPLHYEPSPEGRAELEESLRKRLHIPFEVLNHRAGIRPTTMNRKPILGRHPKFPFAWILNGLGTKGVMQAPWLAKHLVSVIKKNSPSEKIEFDLDRYIRDYL